MTAAASHPHASESAPSPWVARFAPLVAPAGAVLDVACGAGRHTRLFLARGHPVTAIDRDTGRLSDLAAAAGLDALDADLEAAPWPLPARTFAGVVVTNYLHRPLFPRLIEALAPGGALIYETFAAGNEAYGRPRNPDHLLRPGELLDAFAAALSVAAYEHGTTTAGTRPAVRQRICAVKKTSGGAPFAPRLHADDATPRP